MKRYSRVFLPGLLSISAVLGLLQYAEGADKLPVFVSILPQRFVVERIGGEKVDVSVMVSPGQSPATYEPSQKQMAELSRAILFFGIGVPFELVWMPKITAVYPDLRIVDTRAGITLRSMKSHHHEGKSHESEPPAHSSGEKDPHVWLSPKCMIRICQNTCAALAGVDPQNRAFYEANLNALLEDLNQLDREIRQSLASVRSRRFMVFHPAWGYFADEYELEQIPIEIEGKEATARALVRFIDEASEEGVKVIFVQKQFSTTSAKAIAEAIEGRVVPLDPLALDYLDNLRRIARALGEGLK